MDWNNIVKNVSKAVESARQIGEKAAGLSRQAKERMETLDGVSEIVRGKGNITAKSASGTAKESDDASPQPAEGVKREAAEEPASRLSLPVEIASSSAAVSALAEMGIEIAKAIQICRAEETKRAEINARMEVEVSRINAISGLLADYLDKTFDERASLFGNYFSILDKAIASGDTGLMSATLGSINALAAQCPFKDLADLSGVQQQLGQAGTEWDI